MRRIVRDRPCIGCERRLVRGRTYCPACRDRLRRGGVVDTSDDLTRRDVVEIYAWLVALPRSASTLG